MKPLFLLAAAAVCAGNLFAADFEGLYSRAQSLAGRTEGKVFRDAVVPCWLPDGNHFWYRIATGPDAFEYVMVDAETGAVKRASSAEKIGISETNRLSTSTPNSGAPRRSTHTGGETTVRFQNATEAVVDLFWVDEAGGRKPYGRIRPGQTVEQHTYVGHVWLVTDSPGSPLGFFEATPDVLNVTIDGKPEKPDGARPRKNRRAGNAQPGEKPYSVKFENDNAVLIAATGKSIAITTDGTRTTPYRGPVEWSPDGKHGVFLSVQEVPRRIVTVVESSPRDQLQPKVQTYDYFKPGDTLPQVRPVLLSIADAGGGAVTAGVRIVTDNLFTNNFTPDSTLGNLRWSPRGDEFFFDYNQRGHQLYRILAVNATNGAVRTVVEERSKTFVDYETKTWREWLVDSGELIWMSERDGRAHLWLYDVAAGAVKNQITRGDWIVREVLKVDAAKRQVWFLASGMRVVANPYHRQLCRVNFDGGGFVQLTQGDGDNSVKFSPGEKYFIARYSRVDLPTVTELRRSDDGKLVCELEHADASRLVQSGWTMPERFVAKGRDGRTDIYGVIIKPSNFDPHKKYPVVEEVYAGPHDSFAPLKFGRYLRQHLIAELGFIVVQADGMGTDNRGKAFHDVCWKNLKDAGFPDRIAWIKAAAATRPWMDLSRVGIYGGSAGGQSAMRAVLDHHDFYRAAVADCGCHDNRMDKIWWNEQWLGWPVDEIYARSSNVDDAHKLQGKLLLLVGELDRNVDPASTMQVVNALEKAGKHFEMLVLTGTGHGSAETPYGSKRRAEFLVRNLLDANRN
jgi:dipeptidyl aminopeptidase/acylaminoacyl peptidase